MSHGHKLVSSLTLKKQSMEEDKETETWGERQGLLFEELQTWECGEEPLFLSSTRNSWGKWHRNYMHFVGGGNFEPQQFQDSPRHFLVSRVTAKPQSHFFFFWLLLSNLIFFPPPQMVYVDLALHFQASLTWVMDEDLLWTSEPRLECRRQTQYGFPSTPAIAPSWTVPRHFMKPGSHELFQAWRVQTLYSLAALEANFP